MDPGTPKRFTPALQRRTWEETMEDRAMVRYVCPLMTSCKRFNSNNIMLTRVIPWNEALKQLVLVSVTSRQMKIFLSRPHNISTGTKFTETQVKLSWDLCINHSTCWFGAGSKSGQIIVQKLANHWNKKHLAYQRPFLWREVCFTMIYSM